MSYTNSHTARCRDGCLLPMALTRLGAEPETPELRQRVQQAMHTAQRGGDSVRVIPAPGSQRVPCSAGTPACSLNIWQEPKTQRHIRKACSSLFRKILCSEPSLSTSTGFFFFSEFQCTFFFTSNKTILLFNTLM